MRCLLCFGILNSQLPLLSALGVRRNVSESCSGSDQSEIKNLRVSDRRCRYGTCCSISRSSAPSLIPAALIDWTGGLTQSPQDLDHRDSPVVVSVCGCLLPCRYGEGEWSSCRDVKSRPYLHIVCFSASPRMVLSLTLPYQCVCLGRRRITCSVIQLLVCVALKRDLQAHPAVVDLEAEGLLSVGGSAEPLPSVQLTRHLSADTV